MTPHLKLPGLPMLRVKSERDRGRTPRATIVKLAAGMLLGSVLTMAVLIFLAPGPQPAPMGKSAAPDLTITLSDSYLARTASAAINQAHLPVTVAGVRAHTTPGNELTFSGNAQAMFGLVQPSLSATSQLEATDGHLAVHITHATLGGLPLPSLATGAMEGAIDGQLASATTMVAPAGQHYLITGVTTSADHVTIDLTQQPSQ